MMKPGSLAANKPHNAATRSSISPSNRVTRYPIFSNTTPVGGEFRKLVSSAIACSIVGKLANSNPTCAGVNMSSTECAAVLRAILTTSA
jgi:hypothetical protein